MNQITPQADSLSHQLARLRRKHLDLAPAGYVRESARYARRALRIMAALKRKSRKLAAA